MRRSRTLRLAATILSLAALSAASLPGIAGEVAKPKDYPTKAIHWVSPTAAGAAVDLSTRGLANLVDLGVGIVVENIGGGSQTIGTAEVANRAADGYTWLTMANACGITQPLMTDVSYKISDFRHIVMLAPYVQATVAVRADSPIKTTDDLLALFKSDKRYSFGVPNAGGYGHLAIANVFLKLDLFKKSNSTMVVYNGSAETITAILNGEVGFAVLDAPDAYPRVKSGDLRVVSILHNEKCPLFPEADTISNYGVDGTATFVGLKWVSVRKETPPEIVEWIKQELNKVIVTDKYQDYLVRMGFGKMRTYTEEEVTKTIVDAAKDYGDVMRASGMIN